MKSSPLLLALLSALSVLAPSFDSSAENALGQTFAHPPESAKPLAWWHWMNGNITKAGITADLESMARVGIAGAEIMNVANKSAVNIPAGPIKYLSPEWLDLVNFAATEADRLGMKLGLANAAGWSGSGGPWVTPENSMKELVWTETTVSGSQEIKLPQPETLMDFYRDIAVLAFPASKYTSPKKPFEKPKKGESTPGFKSVPMEGIIPAGNILDLTGKLDASGRLGWLPPAGSWTVLRFGYTTNGSMNRPAPESATGLECDKLSRAALDAFWAGGVQPTLDKLGPLSGKVLTAILLDSFEAGTQNWTQAMASEFRQRRGYDLTRYLPVLAGRPVSSAAESDRFLWDFNRTISDLFVDNYFSYLTEKCHKAGLLFACEAYGNGTFEPLTAGAKVDVPMGEFWVNRGIHYSPKLAASVGHTHGQNVIGSEAFTAQSEHGRWMNHPGSLKAIGDLMWCNGINRYNLHALAHQPWLDKAPGMTMGTWGSQFGRTITWWEQSGAWMNYISRAESLLQQGRFVADALLFDGETPTHVPTADPELRQAGYDYDFCGTDLISQLRVENGELVLPSGMRYRLLALKEDSRMRPELAQNVRDLVRDGATIIAQRPKSAPGLTNFPECDAQVKAIANEVWGSNESSDAGQNSFGKGRIVWGKKPVEVLKELAVSPDFQSTTPELLYIHRTVGDSDIYFVSHQGEGSAMADCLFRVTGRQPELWDPMTGSMKPAGLWRTEGRGTRVTLPLGPKGSVFVVFRHPSAPKATTFASIGGEMLPTTSGSSSEGWKPAAWLPELTAKSTSADLLAWSNGSYVLKASNGGEKTVTVDSLPAPLAVEQPWTVDFTPGWGAPARVKFPELSDWSKNADTGVRYYSGTATYRTTLKLPSEFVAKANRLELDLGQVCVSAEVILNGKNLGVLWCNPFRTDITRVAKAGDNALEVRVVNLWPNRIIGDDQFPDDCQWIGKALKDWPDWLKQGKPRPSNQRLTFGTWKHWQKDSPLLPSGLLGPIQVRAGTTTPITP